MIDDSGSGDPAEVPAEVVALRAVDLSERGEPALGDPVDLERLLVRKVGELAYMPVGGDHQVPGRVRKLVQEHECVLTTMNDESLLVIRSGGPAEDAFGLLVRLPDVLQPPRGPQRFCHAGESTLRKPDGVTSRA